MNGLAYKGLVPPIHTNEDFKHWPTSLYPFLGVAPGRTIYADQSLGLYNPTTTLQVIYSSRESGTAPDEMMEDMLTFTQQIQDILIKQVREDRFGMPNDILGMDIESMTLLPTFYTSIDNNRKAFCIAYFNVVLYLGAL